MPINPSQYASTPLAELIAEAGRGRLPLDRRWVRAILADPAAADRALTAYGTKPPSDARIEIDEDILNLLASLPETSSLDYVVTLLREGYEDVPESMLQITRSAGARAIEPLIGVYRELEESSSGEVAFILAGLELKDPRILEILLERLDFDMEDGAMLLGLYGDPAAIVSLAKLSGEIGKNREIDFALEQLKNPAPIEPEAEMSFVDDYPETALPEFEVMSDDEIVEFATEHEDEAVRLAALDVLEDLELAAKVAEPLLELAKSGDSVAVRAAAFRALARLNQIEEVRAAAAAVLEDEVQPKALRAASLITLLPESIDAKRSRAHIEAFLADAESRADGVHAMWRSREHSYSTRFGAYLSDSDVAVRRQAVRGAGVCGDVTAIGKLRDLMMDEDLRKDAIFAYSMAVPSDISASRVKSLFTRIEKEAGGLTSDEATAVGVALDMRLEAAGKDPVFFGEEPEDS